MHDAKRTASVAEKIANGGVADDKCDAWKEKSSKKSVWFKEKF